MRLNPVLLFLSFLFAAVSLVQAERVWHGNPFVRYYHPLEYGGYSQNWHVTRDQSGIIYIANGDGVLEYDGHEWLLHIAGNHLTPTALMMDNGVLWVGAKSDFGVMIPTSGKEMKYVSLKQAFSPEAGEFGFITHIEVSGKNVYFSSSQKTFVWNGKNVKIISHQKASGLFRADDYLLLHVIDEGLKLVSGRKLLSISGSDFFRNKAVVDILPYDRERYIVIARSGGMYVVSFDFSVVYAPRLMTEAKIESETYNHAVSDVIYDATGLAGRRIALATMSGGTYIINYDGSYAGALNRNSGIPNDTHTSLFEDNEGNLWITLDNGIAKVLLSGNFTGFDERNGLKGSVLDIRFFEGHVFAGTWQGLYYMPFGNYGNSGQMFRSFENIRSQSWKLFVVEHERDSSLWVATSDGLFVINNRLREKRISEGLYYVVYQLQDHPGFVLAGHRGGVDVFRLNGDKIIYQETISLAGKDSRIAGIEQDKSGRIWIGTEFYGVFSIDITQAENPMQYEIESYPDDLPYAEYYYLYKYFDEVLYVSRDGVYIVENPQNEQIADFKKFSRFSLSSVFENYYVVNFYQNPFCGDAWIQIGDKKSSRKYFGIINMRGNNLVYDIHSFALLPGFEIYSMRADSSGLLWIGCDDGLFVLTDDAPDENIVYNAIIRTISTNSDSVLFHGSITGESAKINEFANRWSNLKFAFASGSLIDETGTTYRVKLQGFDDGWSSWSNLYSKEYTNLPPGLYHFMVQARDVRGKISKPAVFSFRIAKPWYRSHFAYIIYFVLLIGMIAIINVLTSRRLRKAKQRLEKTVDERTRQIQIKKIEVENEKEKSDRLLLNILPVKIAEELKAEGFSYPAFFESATVLFTDFEGFTKLAQQETSQGLIEKLERFFILFDDIVTRNKLEKIKTIGDSHMSVGGVPVINQTHVFDAVLAAIEMTESLKRLRIQHEWANEWHLRIGIHTGSLIAGIIGRKKFAYDVWGDTVNMSSRLQETGEKDRINVSSEVFKVIESYFDCEPRGVIAVKHKGPAEMFFVNRLKKEYSKNDIGTKPNLEFRKMYWKL